MSVKTFKLFGLKIFEIESKSSAKLEEEKEVKQLKKQSENPQGKILEYTPEEYEEDQKRRKNEIA